MLDYPIILDLDGDGFLARSVDFPEVATCGATREEALIYVAAALEEAMAARIADRRDIPKPSAGTPRAALNLQTSLKVMLYQAMTERNLTKAEMARRLHCHGPQVDRMLDLGCATRLEFLERAYEVAGVRPRVTLVASE